VDAPAVAYHDGHGYGVWSQQVGETSDILYARWGVSIPTPTATVTSTVSPTATATGPPPRYRLYCPYAARVRQPN
jgi:hypothetical protein